MGLKTENKRENVTLKKLETLQDIEIMRASFIRKSFPRHTHDGFGVGVIEKGALGFYYRGENIVASKGDISIVNPDEVHTGHAAHEEGWTYRMFYFTPDVLRNASAEISDSPEKIPFFKSGVIRDNYLAETIKSLHIGLSDGNTFLLEKESLFLRMLVQLIIRHADSPPSMKKAGREKKNIERALNYMRENYFQDISVKELAAAAGLSIFYFIRAFKKETGITPHSYLKQLRLKKAKELIKKSVPIADAALETGFTDQSHLTRNFKNIFGYTPGRYSNSVQDR
jgi:AraC-like DNA-binding protein